ncbi:MAG: phage major capsid protein [Candidatus Nealsonbacteria bacterium]
MKIKKPDGTIVEVADDYTLLEGEEEVKDKGKDEGADESPAGTPGDDAGNDAGDDKDKETDEEKKVKTGLKTFIRSETVKSLEKELNKISDGLVKKFFDGVTKQRANLIDTKKEVKKDSDQEVVRKWFSALIRRDSQAMAEIQKGFMGDTDVTQGGNLVPTQLLAEINRFTEEYGVARRDMRYLPFSGPGNNRWIPALANSVSVYWTAKGEAKTSTKPTFGLVEQTLEKLAAIVPITEEILEDAAINIIALLGELFGEAIAKEEDRVFLNGDTGAGDPYMGAIRAVGIIPVPMGVGVIANITADDLNNLIYAVPRAIRDKGKFYMHSTIFQILQQLKTAQGIYIVQSPVGAKPGSIWNRPYELVDILPDNSVSGEDEPVMFYTDLSKTCVYGDKQGLRVKLLDQAIVKSAEESPSDLNLATQDMVALRIAKRVGYVPVLPAGIAVLQLGAES